MQGVEALPCGHLFHSECINRYCDATGRNKATACPLKCGSVTSTSNFFSAIGRRGGGRGSNDPVPVEDDANDPLQELMQEIDRQIVDERTHPEERAEVPDPVVD